MNRISSATRQPGRDEAPAGLPAGARPVGQRGEDVERVVVDDPVVGVERAGDPALRAVGRGRDRYRGEDRLERRALEGGRQWELVAALAGAGDHVSAGRPGVGRHIG